MTERRQTSDPNINLILTMVNAPQLCFAWIFFALHRNGTVLVQNAAGAGRYHVDDVVSAYFELAQEARQHLGSLCLGVVKQHDAAANLIDPAEDQAHFLV